jgi:hypothetical protein
MKRVKALCMPVLLGVLLLATLVGVASARPHARPVQQAWRVLSVAAGHCYPAVSGANFLNNGWEVHCGSPQCFLMCPVNFPAAGEQAVGAVTVKRFTMYAFDNNSGATADVQAWLIKSYPPTHARVYLAQFQTAGAQVTDPQVLMDTTIEYNPVYRTQAPYIAIIIGGSTDTFVYGFFVHYTW